MRKKLPEFVVAAVLVFGFLAFAAYGPPRFWGDFKGMTEAEVRAELGVPFRDSRDRGDGDPQEYTLGWRQGFETGLFLTFRDGVVVSQQRFSR